MRFDVQKFATIENAQKWASTDAPFVFCLDLMNLSLAIDGDDKCFALVEKLELKFDRCLNSV